MYKLHLIRKYLLKRRIAWVALLAVTLCTAMVLVVFSVMNGWLETFEGSFHGMTGDVVVQARSLAGFPYYAEMIGRVQREVPGVAAAVPAIHSGGLINVGTDLVSIVQVVGYPPDVGRVNDWPTTLTRQGTTAGRPGGLVNFGLLPGIDYGALVRNKRAAKTARLRPGMIVAGPVVGINHADPAAAAQTRDIMVRLPVTLTLLPVGGGEGIDVKQAVTVPFWIVDDSKSRVWQLDNENVYIAFDEAQRALHMDADGPDPARCSEIQIKVTPEYQSAAKLAEVRDAVGKIANEVTDAHGSFTYYRFDVQTWVQQQGAFIHAVQNEVVITTVLFGIISMVAVLLIFCIFYMIVVEKTRDIGIIKSVGATGGGIMSLFLIYGLAIGVIGSAAGVTIAFLIVRNINELHAWLGRVMHIQIWSAETYQFDRIPSKMEATTVAWTVGIALVAAVLGALLPAVRAAGMNPVDSLRYE